MSYYSDNALIESLVVKNNAVIEGDCIISGALTADVSGLTADFTIVDASIVALRAQNVTQDASIVNLQAADGAFATNASVNTLFTGARSVTFVKDGSTLTFTNGILTGIS